MKRYQVKRWDQRNTLRLKKYAYPMWFMMNLVTVMLTYIMFNIN